MFMTDDLGKYGGVKLIVDEEVPQTKRRQAIMQNKNSKPTIYCAPKIVFNNKDYGVMVLEGKRSEKPEKNKSLEEIIGHRVYEKLQILTPPIKPLKREGKEAYILFAPDGYYLIGKDGIVESLREEQAKKWMN